MLSVFTELKSLLFLLLQGFGMLLMEEAERIAKEEHGSWKIAVISGIFALSPPFFFSLNLKTNPLQPMPTAVTIEVSISL